jgi:nicotinate-nucleotide adenylyltransferase
MIGIFGGTFDPVHYGHLRPAREAKAALALEHLYLVPAATPPHRQVPVATANQRRDMLALALGEFDDLELDERELLRDGISYTVDTLQAFRLQFPETSLALLMGTDAFDGIESWHQWQRLPELAHLVILQRPGTAPRLLPGWAVTKTVNAPERLEENPAGHIYFQTVAPQPISATAIRQNLATGNSVEGLLPRPVLDYINANRIYSN